MSKEQYNTIEHIPANRKLIESLYAHGKITSEGRKHSLDLLYPRNQWGAWVSRLLLFIGCTLILSGIIFFFASNWDKITPFEKLFGIEFAIIACLMLARSPKKLLGKILLLSASVLVGVFLAVFGQIYQTGADAYQLFMAWSILIFGWIFIANFSAGWLFWLVITNLSIILWWNQTALAAKEMREMIFVYMTILNGTALILREYFTIKYNWFRTGWIRYVLVTTIIATMLIPILIFISNIYHPTKAVIVGTVVGFLGNISLYFLYRYKLPDIWSLAISIFSIAIITASIVLEISQEVFHASSTTILLIMSMAILIIFTGAVIHLRGITKKMGGQLPCLSI